jgi:hypothetical protein
MLPVRPISNLLKPFGVPSKAWTKRKPRTLQQPKHGPCKIAGHISGEFVYDEMGAMPDDASQCKYVFTGFHRLDREASGSCIAFASLDGKRKTVVQSMVFSLGRCHLGEDCCLERISCM